MLMIKGERMRFAVLFFLALVGMSNAAEAKGKLGFVEKRATLAEVGGNPRDPGVQFKLCTNGCTTSIDTVTGPQGGTRWVITCGCPHGCSYSYQL